MNTAARSQRISTLSNKLRGLRESQDYHLKKLATYDVEIFDTLAKIESLTKGYDDPEHPKAKVFRPAKVRRHIALR